MSANQKLGTDTGQKLEAVINSVRNREVPPFPDSLVDFMPEESSNTVSKAATRKLSVRMLRLSVSLLAAISALVFVAAVVLLPNNQIAFAQVQEVLKDVKSVRYNVLDIHGDKKTYLTHVMIQKPHLTRSESDHGGISISNLKTGKIFTIDHRNKTATLFETSVSDRMQQARKGHFASLKNISSNSIKRLGATTFEGRPAEQFLANRGEREFVVTVDGETKLPVEMKFTRGDFVEILTDFEFGIELDPALFEMKVPEGYASAEKLIGEQHPLAEELVVSTANGLNHLGFQSSVEEAIEFLGQPDQRKERKYVGPGGGTHQSKTLHYPDAGLKLFYNSDGLASISCQSNSLVIDFAGKTDTGIKFDDPITKVIDIYGQPDVKSERTLHYLRKGITFSSTEGVVSGIQLNGEADPRIEFIVSEDGQSWTQRVRTQETQD